jgi:hypothetical protein
MSNKNFIAGFLSATVFSAVFLTTSASAFWPFDNLFSKGIVKAITTDMENTTGSKKNTWAPETRPTGTLPQMTVVNAITAMNSICEKLETSTSMKIGNQKKQVDGSETTNETISEKKIVVMDKEISDIHNKLRSECLNIKKLNARLGKVSPYVINKPKEIILNSEEGIVAEKVTTTPSPLKEGGRIRITPRKTLSQ